MKDKNIKGSLVGRLKYLSWSLILLWTICLIASLLWNLHEEREKVLNIACNSAQITFENDVLYRKWVAKQGGVYVPVSAHTPPNPYLNVPNRDITTSSGLLLTLVNPAYMVRQVNQMAMESQGSRGHLTSLKPIRPENAPDPWETTALMAFEQGAKEVSSVGEIAGEEYLRLMRPFLVEKACLKCHASQGYKEGDIRGGISFSVPMAPLWAIEKRHIANVSMAHALLWIIGIAGIMISRNGLGKQILAREQAELDLSERTNNLRIVADFTYDWEYWRTPDNHFVYISPSCERLTGYTREEFMEDPTLYLRIIHPDDRERVAAHLNDDQSHWQLGDLEFRILRRDGRERWIGHVCHPVTDEQGKRLGRRASNRDITERKEAEISLRNTTSELRQLNQSLERRVQERTEELQKSQGRLQQLASQLLLAQEKERKRTAVELHDTLLSELAGMKYLLEANVLSLKEMKPSEIKGFDRITEMIQKLMKDIRNIMNNLRPSILDEIGLIPTIEWLSKEFQKTHGHIRVRKQLEAVEKDIPDFLRAVIFRVIQESLDNFAKHGEGDFVELSLIESGDTLQLRIRDNGQGFDVGKVKRGLGLESMQERVELSGGFFRVESAEGKGTAISASWSIRGTFARYS